MQQHFATSVLPYLYLEVVSHHSILHWFNTHFGMETRVKVILILIGGFLMVLSIKDQFFDYYRQQEDFDG